VALVIGVGVDLCEIDRMRTALERTPQLRDRLFTAEEQGYCDERTDPTERYAARFAAKEAVLKALGLGIGACKWREIEVARADGGAPSVRLHGAAQRLADERGVTRWHLSLSHTRSLAEAIAVAE
jgi:holo-[acyl-carrier protein] synthase